MELGKHISYLLQFHECVVVPDFGGFISNYKPAGYDRMREVFLPPSKEVVFNAKIKKNDGLLINCIVDKEQCSYRDAEGLVERFVDNASRLLNKGEKVSLESVGSFHYEPSGAITFTAAPKFEFAEAYGLEPFSFAPVESKKESTERYQHPAVRALNTRKGFIKIAAGIALVLGLSLFPLRNNNTGMQSSNVNPLQLFSRSENTLNKASSEELTLEDIEKVAPYVLVGGSFSHPDNARQLQAEMIKKGFNAEVIEHKSGLYRVTFDSYFDRDEALNAMRTYRSEHPESNVWVSTR
ncbi:MAG: SPOR domain-containing protein [Prolixibacteraceae bacterium]|nr:SPOR domain-containing protein [Prolixibacteraceae bacterium]